MRIIVMSDSHGDEGTVSTVSSLIADAHFHCGDSELLAENPIFDEIYKVRGNCDFDSRFPKEVLVSVGGKLILMVHGHEHDIKVSLKGLYYRAKEKDADIVLFGHSHLYGAGMRDGILFVNPGSTMQPRGGNPPTYAVIEWDESPIVTFKNMDHEVVDWIDLEGI